jgi:hypothetical protein
MEYPWHPLYGQEVLISGDLHRPTAKGFKCHVEEDQKDKCIFIPAWKFDRLVCSKMNVLQSPRVSVQALMELKRLLEETRQDKRTNSVHDGYISNSPGGGTHEKSTASIPEEQTDKSVSPKRKISSMEKYSGGNKKKSHRSYRKDALRVPDTTDET